MHAPLLLALCLAAAEPAAPLHLTFDDGAGWNDPLRGIFAEQTTLRGFHPGALVKPVPRTNTGSLEFDGTRSLLFIKPAPASAAAFTPGSFTWEGFFFSPAGNAIETDGAIGDRFISQFRDDKLGATRLTVGLSKSKKYGPTLLCVALAGSETRHFGKKEVTSDVWHHFAVVYETPQSGTAAATPILSPTAPQEAKSADKKGPPVNVGGKLAWYLDYEKCGEIVFDGKDVRTTLEPLGGSPLVIGGRNIMAGKVDRGFQGLLDELRITPHALKPEEMLKTAPAKFERLVKAELYYPLSEAVDLASFTKQIAAGRKPTETVDQETLGVVGLPTAFSLGGFVEARRGVQAVRTSRELTLPAGGYRILIRTVSDAVLELDGRTLVDARRAAESPLGPLPLSDRDYVVDYVSDGKPHMLRLTTLIDFGGTGAKLPQVADSGPTKPEATKHGDIDEVIVGTAKLDEKTGRVGPWQVLGPEGYAPLDAYAWRAARGRTLAYWNSLNEVRRTAALKRRDAFWGRRHAWARLEAEKWNDAATKKLRSLTLPARENLVDALLVGKMKQLGVKPAPVVDDATFLRRITLDLAGRNPTVAECESFLNDPAADKREKLVDRLLASSEWADSWVGYWQDLLAENPSILKPTLNNSGPFRRWIHESFAANKPLDQFAAELMLMQGDDDQGGTAGFAIASGNDLPMAMKGHVVAQAFLGVDMKCARCHDGPNVPFEQSDLFGLAAMLDEKPITVPAASTVVVPPGARKPGVTSRLKVGDKVAAEWPLEEIIPRRAAEAGPSLVQEVDRPRAELAAIITSPVRSRFSDVAVNRIWKRYFGTAIVESVDQWLSRDEASHPELLAYLSQEFVRDGYDMKRLVRTLVTSKAYQRAVGTDAPIDPSQRTYAMQARRRASAEQLVDSLFTAVGKPMNAEELNFDPNGTQGFLVLPAPRRSWQFASLSNERDRPALALPMNQMILDVLSTFGWRESRIDPWTRQDAEVNPLQPLMLANSTVVNQAVRLTEDNAVTQWCLEETTPETLVERMFLATLARKPNAAERQLATEVLAEGFATRRTGKPKPPPVSRIRAHVDWDKHLKGEASVELLEAEKQARAGDPPTVRLTDDFRRRAEDVLWSLINTPEFVFVP